MSDPESAAKEEGGGPQANRFWVATVVSIGGSIGIGVLNYFTRYTLAQNLSIEDFGFFYGAFAFLSIFLSIIDLGMGQSTTLLMARHLGLGDRRAAESTYSVLAIGRLLLSLASVVLLFVISKWVVYDYFNFPKGHQSFLLLCLFLPFSTILGGVVAALEASGDFMSRNAVLFSQYGIIFIVVFVGPGGDLMVPAVAFVGSVAFTGIIANGWLYWRHRIRFRLPGSTWPATAKEAWGTARWFALTTAGFSFASTLDVLMLTYFSDVRAVGLYNIALPILQIMMIVMALSTVFAPSVARLWAAGDRQLVSTFFGHATIISLWLGLAMSLGTFLCGGAAIKVLFGEQFLEAQMPLTILSLQVPFVLISQLVLSTQAAMNRPAWMTGTVGVGLLVNAGLNIVLVPRYGMGGAAASTAVSHAVIAVVGMVGFRGTIAVWNNAGRWAIIVLLGVGMAALGLRFAPVSSIDPWSILWAIGIAAVFGLISLPILWSSIKWLIRHG